MTSEVEIQPWSANEYANLALVQEVKKHPCLYNNTIPEYSQKNVTGPVWQEIADKFGCSVPAVKKKWMGLRGAYIKDFRKRKEGKMTIHPIAPHMEFIHPYMVKYQQSNIHKCVQENLSDVLHAKINQLYPPKNTELTVEGQEFYDAVDYNDLEVTEFIVVEGDNKLTITNSTDFNVISSVNDETAAFETVENETEIFNIVDAVDNETESYNIIKSEAESFNTVSRKNYVPHTVNIKPKPSLSCSLPLNDSESPKDSDQSVSNSYEYHARLHYLLSLFSEVDEMTEKQFRIFKRKMLALIDTVKDTAV